MLKKILILLAISCLLQNTLRAQVPELYYLQYDSGDSSGFISLSEVYSMRENAETPAMPDFSDHDASEAKKYEHLQLDTVYRERFLSGTKISETDSVFIYDYSLDILVAVPVNKLKVVAYLNVYGAAWPYTPGDYMIGFKIDKKYLVKLSSYYSRVFVSIGKKQPFLRGKLQPIQWEKIESKDFPVWPVQARDTARWRAYKCIAGDAYVYTRDGLKYYLQEYFSGNRISVRRLILLKSKSEVPLYERFYFESESAGPAGLGEQWTGELFKRSAAVLFGFEYLSYSCPEIVILEEKPKSIFIRCDNRH